MLDPAEPHRVEPDAPQLSEPVRVLALDGFVDAGAAARLAVWTCSSRPGRGSRWCASTWTSSSTTGRDGPCCGSRPIVGRPTRSELEVVALTDSGGTEHLLLSGPEPDTQWEVSAAAVEQLVRRLDVRLVVTMAGISMAVPHTCPTRRMVHGTRSELTEGRESLFAAADVPGSAVALTEYRLGQAGHAAMGFAVHVPHYLARAEYPRPRGCSSTNLAVATGLYLSTEALTTAAERTEREIAEQVAGSEEVAQVVAALERQR